jgi:hypothetical protein
LTVRTSSCTAVMPAIAFPLSWVSTSPFLRPEGTLLRLPLPLLSRCLLLHETDLEAKVYSGARIALGEDRCRRDGARRPSR